MDWRGVDKAHRASIQLMATSQSLSEVLDEIVKSVEPLAPSQRCAALMISDDGEHLVLGAAPSMGEAYAELLQAVPLDAVSSPCGMGAVTDQTVVVEDLDADPRWGAYSRMARALGVVSCWVQPIRARRGRVLGVFVVYHPEPATPSGEELAFLQATAALIALGIERQKLDDLVSYTSALAQDAALNAAETERELTLCFDAALDLMVLYEPGRGFVRVSQSFVDTFGHPREAILGQTFHAFFHLDDQAVVEARQAALTRGGAVEDRTMRVRHRDGHHLEIEWRTRRIGDRTFAVGRDVTDRLATAADMAAARAAAEAASNAKSVFLTTMSHEIRTPLNGVLGMVEVMAKDELNPAQQGRLDVVRRSGEALLTVLDDLLDLAKVASGRAELALAPFDMEHLVRSVADAYAPTAAAKAIDFSFAVALGARGRYVGDGGRLRRILYALLSNAVKFTQAGRIRLEVEPGDVGRVIVRISDTGIGIASQDQRRMFDAFEQGETALTRQWGGAGLGLAISKESARLMGGDIAVESRPGEGATFTVDVPLVQAGPDACGHPGEAVPEPTVGAERLAPIKVLVAEDHQVNRLVIRAMLAQLGVDAVLVEDGQKALEAWEGEDWDAILMDIQMPVMDGLTASQEIRAREQSTGRDRTPILAVTANAMAHQVEAYAAAGIDDVVRKPIEPAALVEALRTALAQADPKIDAG